MAMAAPNRRGKAAASWRHIGLYGHSVGTLTADTSAIQWKSPTLEENSISTIKLLPADSLRLAKWTVFGRSGHLRITSITPIKKGSSAMKTQEYRFDGFPPTEFERISQTLKSLYNLDVIKHTMSSSGYSFGKADISGSHLVYRQCIVDDEEEEGEDGDEMLTLDLTEVSQCVLPGNNRNEIELQFHESDTVEQGTDQCVQIRFYVPPDADADPDAPTNAELFQQRIMTKAHIKNTTGNVIAEFDESMGTFLTPRGRYAIELYDSFLRLRGSKYDYKIKYDDISRLFLLPRPDEVHMAFVIALDKPIRQGQQRYNYLVLQTNKEPSEVAISLDEETLQREYNGALQPVMTGSLSNLIAKTFKVITKKKVFVPGKFTNSNQQECVKCALRANDGHLYPLEKQLIFIHKPALLIRFDEVQHVEFQRYAGGQGSTRNFDLCVTLKNVSDDASSKLEYTFSGIDRTDYTPLHNFLVGKNIKILNIQDPIMDTGPSIPEYNEDVIYGIDSQKNDGRVGGNGSESSEDEDYKSGHESSSEDISSDEDEDDDISEGTDEDLEEARARAKKESSRKSQTTIKTDGSISKKSKKRSAEEASKPEKKSKIKRSKSDDGDSQTISSKNSKTSKKTTKSKKDPNAPKKYGSAYTFFVKENRARIKEENPDATFGELSKIVSQKFKGIDADEKEKYEEMVRKDKKRYGEEMKNYVPPSDDEDESQAGSQTKPKKAKKDPNAPKKARNSYTYFCQQNRAKLLDENPNLSFSEMSKLQSATYRKLSPEEKQKYVDLANRDKERYTREMKAYQPSGGGSSVSVKKESKKVPVKKVPVKKVPVKKVPVKKEEPESDSDDSSVDDSDSDSDSDSD